MKKSYLLLIISVLMNSMISYSQPFGLVIHGGAGSITPASLSDEQRIAYENALDEALDIGYGILEGGGTSEEAVIATIRFMEDSPLFNAGKGSVLNAEGKVEMDASIMLGQDLRAGAVAGVSRVRNPIEAAALVMHKSPHVMMSNRGADQFAKDHGLQREKPGYFITPRSIEALERAQEHDKEQGNTETSGAIDEKFGTVGVVALDKFGNLAAGTSTGGMTNKMYNRIGDSPVIGAGTYANNQGCAVSCTGHGEYFIRLNVAHEVSALMMYKQYDIEKAASLVIHQKLQQLGGSGGLIALDRKGNFSMPFNTPGMFRAYRMNDGRAAVLMFAEDI